MVMFDFIKKTQKSWKNQMDEINVFCALCTAGLPCHAGISDNVAVNDISGLENWTGQIYGAAEAVIAQTLVVPFLHQRSAY